MAVREQQRQLVMTADPALAWVRLVFVALVGVVVLFIGTHGPSPLLVWGVLTIVAAYAAADCFLGLYRRFRWLLTRRVYAAIDLALITFLVAITGGSSSPLYMLYSLPLAVTVLTQGARAGALYCMAVSVLYGAVGAAGSPTHSMVWVAHLGIFWGLYLLLAYVTYAEETREEKARRRDELGAMHSAATAPVHTGDIPTVVERILTGALGATHSCWVAIFLYEETDDRFVTRYSLALDDHDGDVRQEQVQVYASDVLYTVLYTGTPMAICDVHSDRRLKDSVIRREHVRAALVLPLATGDRRIGVLCFGRAETHRFSQHEMRFSETLAKQAAVAIHTAVLFEEAASIEAAKEADKLRAQLLATVSHELRTPIAAIQGFASSLRCADGLDIPKEMEQDWICEIESNAERLRRLVTDLLDLSRLEAGALRMNFEWQDLHDILEELRPNLEILAGSRKLVVQVQPSLPLVRCDAERVGQVLTNLLENAAKFSPPDSMIVVGAERHEGGVKVGVLDEGQGVPPEFRERVFERFYQVEDGSPGRQHGTGLGLAICKNIIEAHGGRIWVESSAGQGSIFYFTLPSPSTRN